MNNGTLRGVNYQPFLPQAMRQLDMGGRLILNLEPSLSVPALQFSPFPGVYQGPNLADVGVMIHSQTTYKVGNNPNQPGLSYSDIRSAPTITGVTPAGNVEIYGGSFTPTLAGTSAGGCAAYAGIAVNAVANSGTVTTGYAHRSIFTNNGATTTTAVVFDGQLLAAAGTIGTSIGLRLTSLGGTNIWGIQVGAYNNYFAGNSSFGTTGTPTYPVDAFGTIRASNASASAPGFIAALTGIPTGSNFLAGYQDQTSIALGSSSSASYASFYANATCTDAFPGAFYGLNANIKTTGAFTGAPSALIGTMTQAGSGTIPTGVGMSGSYVCTSGTTTLAYGSKSNVIVNGGTITKFVGYGISSLLFSGTLTTAVGLDIGVTSALSGTTVWGFQVGNYQSFHQGKLAIGGSSAPANTVDIQGGALNYNVDTMTYAATITLDVTKGNVHKTTTTVAVGDATINASAATVAGEPLHILITNDATAQRTITFGTNFKPTATLVGTISKSAVVSFISDGTNYYEFARTTGL